MTTVSLVAKIAGEKFLIPRLNVINFLETGPFFGEFLTRFLFVLIFVASTHNRQRNLQIQLDSAQDLNRNLSDQYSMLINSDEEIRSHASRLLHDRIQAKLMLAGAKLTRLSGLLSDEGRLGVLPVIKEIEHIRSIDVREVSQLLTPNLVGEGLVGSCENLIKEFEGPVKFDINISAQTESLCVETKLAVYRIIEQGVINSIKHGPANQISIHTYFGAVNELVIEIGDDGPGKRREHSGSGTVIIDAWVSVLGGKKEIESEFGKGFTLRVTAPVKL